MKSLSRSAAAIALLCAGATVASAADDSTLALVPGGPHPYFAAWEQAGVDAAADLGLGEASYKIPQKWELAQQNQLLESLLSQGYNGFLIFPGDPVGAVSTAEELAGFGSPIIAGGGCYKDPSPAAFCLGTDTGNSAYLGAKELIKAMGDGEKRIAHFTGFLVDPNTQLRIDAVLKAAEEEGATVVQVIADIDAPEPAEEKINAYLAANAGEVDGIIATAWVPAVVAANALRRMGTDDIAMVGIDHDEAVISAIKDGVIDGTMIQNPYGQGYIGAYALDKLRSGCTIKDDAPFGSNALTEKFIDSGTAYVDASNADSYLDTMRAETDRILADFDATYLNCE
ncbi:sugar ABC transporter substrate-binding protein [Psychromarinibacter halotolerans]|uniref:Sugar ABC transporter substrate-binding protein n=1 Tax=Psychromarinibacter halotolerans TaxID=1775175 RepID=A0ABV7GUB3_9RHOB|nr:sugar ABC transporter substrate-binding protein [Psychromarinibacter halotolerans]MAQ85437.1 sugar ABC transporter substrate-binding protein [Maritimibacter sp.]MDF0595288.1 sugar ABC transporter substrate-binding protein [Psychromarinibacter halotolerans]